MSYLVTMTTNCHQTCQNDSTLHSVQLPLYIYCSHRHRHRHHNHHHHYYYYYYYYYYHYHYYHHVFIKIVLSLFAITTAISTSHLCTFYFSPDFTFEIHVKEKWDDQLEDKDSEKYKKISTLLKEQVLLKRTYNIFYFLVGKAFHLRIPS